MKRLGYVGLYVAWGLLPACHAGLLDDGEFTRSQCSDGVDNDMDQAIDCEEASCMVFDICRHPMVSDAATHGTDAGGLDAGIEDAGETDARIDATVVDAAIDAGPPVQVDGGLCEGSTQPCTDAGACINDTCVQPFPGRYAINVLTATVVRSKPAMDGNEDCFDTLSGCDIVNCYCTLPDPFVRVLVDDTQIDTSVQRSTLMPNWRQNEERAIGVNIDSPETTLTLQVRDDDSVLGDDLGSDADDELMFECENLHVDVSALPDQPLGCTKQIGDSTVQLEATLNFFETR